MGDAGALFLGLLMAVSTMVIGGRTTDVTGQTYFFFAPLLIPLFILGVPLVDMAFAFVRRTAKGTRFHSPDKDHIHHRLLRLGHGPRRTVVILWGWTAILSGFVLVPLYFPRGNTFIPLGAAVLVLTLYTWFHPGLRKSDPAFDEQGAMPEDESGPPEESGPDESEQTDGLGSPGGSADPVTAPGLAQVSNESLAQVSNEDLVTAPTAESHDPRRPVREKSHKTVLTATDAAQTPPLGGRADRFVAGGQIAPPERIFGLRREP
jgi:hypothetical protein